jgi:hypothetical protein
MQYIYNSLIFALLLIISLVIFAAPLCLSLLIFANIVWPHFIAAFIGFVLMVAFIQFSVELELF